MKQKQPKIKLYVDPQGRATYALIGRSKVKVKVVDFKYHLAPGEVQGTLTVTLRESNFDFIVLQ